MADSAEGAFGEDPKAKEDFDQLARQEMDVWKSMISGKAVQEHTEDVYHDMLKVYHLAHRLMREHHVQTLLLWLYHIAHHALVNMFQCLQPCINRRSRQPW